MPVSRRSFVRTLGVGSAGSLLAPWITARGQEALASGGASFELTETGLAGLDAAERNGALSRLAWPSDAIARARIASPNALRLDSNENPNGPGPAALNAVRAAFGEACRYPDLPTDALRTAVALAHRVEPDNVILGCGSGEVLRMAVYAFTSPARALVTGAPSFEDPQKHAETIGSPVRAVRVDAALKLDLAAMAAAAHGSGLIFLCNPNNPTATLHPAHAVRDFVTRALANAPDATILIDEAYHEYVEDPAYATAIPLAMENPRVVVARTFSKVHGMAGLRVGYAIGHKDTIATLHRQRLPNSINVLGASAALASLAERGHVEREHELNREARELTRRALKSMGYAVGQSNANFIMVDVRRDSREFQKACRAQGVLVGRPFPPLTSHARISIGTMAEMHRALDVFRSVLRVTWD